MSAARKTTTFVRTDVGVERVRPPGRDRLGERLGPRVVLGEPLDVLVQRDETGARR